MAFIVVYDANAMVGNTLRDLLVRIAQSGLVQAKWTEQILDETFAAVLKSRPDVDPDKLSRVRELMVEAVPDSLVHGHEPLIDGLQLPDPDDRHVLAAAIKAGAQVIVTATRTSPQRPWSRGASRRRPPTTSCSTWSISTTGSSGHASRRS